MQIWEPVPNKEASFRLLYETHYVLTAADNGNITVSQLLLNSTLPCLSTCRLRKFSGATLILVGRIGWYSWKICVFTLQQQREINTAKFQLWSLLLLFYFSLFKFVWFQITPSQPFTFKTDVRIGWTVESLPGKDTSWIPISFEFQERYKLYFVNLDARNPMYPKIGSAMEFGHLPYPAMFSVSMTVDVGAFGKQEWLPVCKYLSLKSVLMTQFMWKYFLSTFSLHFKFNCVQSRPFCCSLIFCSFAKTTTKWNKFVASGFLLLQCGWPWDSQYIICNQTRVFSGDSGLATVGHEVKRRELAGFESRPRSWVEDNVSSAIIPRDDKSRFHIGVITVKSSRIFDVNVKM